MLRRLYVGLLLIAWVMSAGWLVSDKILPPLLPGQRPEVVSDLDRAKDETRAVEDWTLLHQGEQIGESHSYYLLGDGGDVEVRTRTIFRDFPLRTVLQSFVGPFGALLRTPIFDQNVTFEIVSRAFYSADRLDRVTMLALHDRGSVLARFELTRGEGTDYDLVVTSPSIGGRGDATELLRRTISLGERADAEGPFSVAPRMLDLRVGQTWTEPVAKPFTSSGEVQLIRATVDRRELLSWHGVPMRTDVVEYRQDTGVDDDSRKPDAVAWIDESGETLQQDVRLGSTTFRMVRMPQDDPPDVLSDAFVEPTGLGDDFVQQFEEADAGVESRRNSDRERDEAD